MENTADPLSGVVFALLWTGFWLWWFVNLRSGRIELTFSAPLPKKGPYRLFVLGTALVFAALGLWLLATNAIEMARY